MRHPLGWSLQLGLGLGFGGALLNGSRAPDGTVLVEDVGALGFGGLVLLRLTRFRTLYEAQDRREHWVLPDREILKPFAINVLVGSHLSFDLPLAVEYAAPLSHQGQGLRFRVGLALTLEGQADLRFQYSSLLNLVLPEVGLLGVAEAGVPLSLGVYLGLARFSVTYWPCPQIGLRFGYTTFVGWRGVESSPGAGAGRRFEWGALLTAMVLLRAGPR